MLSGLLKTAETLKVKGLAEVSGEQSAANNAANASATPNNNNSNSSSITTSNSTPQTPTSQLNALQSNFRLGVRNIAGHFY